MTIIISTMLIIKIIIIIICINLVFRKGFSISISSYTNRSLQWGWEVAIHGYGFHWG